MLSATPNEGQCSGNTLNIDLGGGGGGEHIYIYICLNFAVFVSRFRVFKHQNCLGLRF